MPLADLRAGILDAVYDELSNPALWNGQAVSVRDADADDLVDLGAARIVAASVVIKVRASEVAAPVAGDSVTIADAAYAIIGTPRRNVRGEWVCEAERV